MTDAVVLAGGTIPDREASFREAVGVPCKSLIPLCGRIMVSYLVDALKAAQGVNRVAVVGPESLQGHPDCHAADLILPEAEGRSENLFLGVDAFPEADRVVMMTSDTPLVTAEMIDDALAAFGPEVDLGYVLVAADTVFSRFADRPAPPPDERGHQMPNWVTLSLRDGRFTGTSFLVIKPAAAQKLRGFIKGVFDNRELGNVVRVLRPVFGLGFLLKVALVLKFPRARGLVGVGDVEKRLSRGLGILCRTYVSPYAEMAFDVDHLADVPLAEEVLRARKPGI